jgi:predicted MFS family arabinose efflux permease
MLSAGLLAGKYLAYMFVPIIFIGLICVLFSLFLSEKRITQIDETGKKKSQSIVKIIFANRLILALFAVGLLSNFVYEGADQFWQVLFKEIKHVTANNFGFLTAAGLILVTLSVRFTRKLYDRLTFYVISCFTLTAVALFVSVHLYWSSAIFGLIVYFALKEFVRPAISTHLNRQFNSANRATYLSTYNLTCSIGEVIAGILAGTLVSLYGVEFIFYFSALLAILIPIVFMIIKQKRNKSENKP